MSDLELRMWSYEQAVSFGLDHKQTAKLAINILAFARGDELALQGLVRFDAPKMEDRNVAGY